VTLSAGESLVLPSPTRDGAVLGIAAGEMTWAGVAGAQLAATANSAENKGIKADNFLERKTEKCPRIIILTPFCKTIKLV
jgi:hypothetical protein